MEDIILSSTEDYISLRVSDRPDNLGFEVQQLFGATMPFEVILEEEEKLLAFLEGRRRSRHIERTRPLAEKVREFLMEEDFYKSHELREELRLMTSPKPFVPECSPAQAAENLLRREKTTQGDKRAYAGNLGTYVPAESEWELHPKNDPHAPEHSSKAQDPLIHAAREVVGPLLEASGRRAYPQDKDEVVREYARLKKISWWNAVRSIPVDQGFAEWFRGRYKPI